MCRFRFIVDLLAVSLCLGRLPSDPHDAGPLYYQAFLLCPAPDPATKDLLNQVVNGAEPDERIREYLETCRGSIRYAEMASRMPDCNWGVLYSLGFHYRLPHLESVRLLSRVLYADAQVLAADADYRAAFERCLTIRRLARHAGTETVHFYATAMETESLAQKSICQILRIDAAGCYDHRLGKGPACHCATSASIARQSTQDGPGARPPDGAHTS